MESWQLDRIDFVKEAHCSFCKRALKSNVAFILVGIDGQTAAAGPTCAKRNAPKAVVGVPNFTKASFDIPGEEMDDILNDTTQVSSTAGQAKNTSGSSGSAAAIEYLRLRVELLVGFPSARTSRLDDINRRYKSTTTLSNDDLNYLCGLIRKVERDRPELSPNNLQACYAYSFWIQRFLDDEKSDYVEGLLIYLQKNLHLKERQIIALNRWFANRHGLPKLNPKAFVELCAQRHPSAALSRGALVNRVRSGQ